MTLTIQRSAPSRVLHQQREYPIEEPIPLFRARFQMCEGSGILSQHLILTRIVALFVAPDGVLFGDASVLSSVVLKDSSWNFPTRFEQLFRGFFSMV